MQRITTPTPGRNPPHFSQPSRAGADLRRSAFPTEPEATPRPRSFIASEVVAERARLGTSLSGLVLDHVSGLQKRVPQGKDGQVVRGGDTARDAACGFETATRRNWGVHEGTGPALLRKMHKRGYLRDLPGPKVCGQAMAMLARLSPLIQVVKRGVYRIHAGDPRWLPAEVVQALKEQRSGDATAADELEQTPADAVQIDALADRASAGLASSMTPNFAEKVPPQPTADGSVDRSTLRACGASEPAPAPAVACSSYAPAERAGARPATPPARAPRERRGLPSRSDWLRAVPKRRNMIRAAMLALAHLSGEGRRGSAAIVAAGLAGHEPRATGRSRASLARALEALRQRGLLVVTDDLWRVAEFVAPAALRANDLLNVGDARPISAAQAAQIRRYGIDPTGLGHAEAVALCRRLWTRRSKAALVREQKRADLPPDLRRSGRLDLADARVGLSRAMEAARWAVDPWTVRDHGGRHG